MSAPYLELLAPAGGPEQFNAALAAGANAIYCGFGHHFNARRGATSFDDESFAEACRRAHLAGARVYVTTNVVIKTSELPRALSLVRRAWLLGADAFIIQDWGLLREVRRLWPQVETHISTQANVHDARGVAWCRDAFGAARVTLSRELSVPEIARIAQEGVELEGFGHGALCFCYSGICQMSSLGGDRSANRGLCAQPCRLPYDLVDEQGESLVGGTSVRPLCPKDFRTIGRLAELTSAGLGSLKIEGRLKGPEYVHAVVSAYRSAIDELAGGVPALGAAERDRLLRRAFNRDFTDAYLDGTSDNDMMSYERSNNRGELVGRVVASRDLGSSRVWRGGTNGGRERSRKVTLAEVDILLDEPVGRGDLLEIRPVDDPSQFLTANAGKDAETGETITCRTPRPMAAGSLVRVIRSQQALDDAARVARSDMPRLRPVRVRVKARLGEPFEVSLETEDGRAQGSASGFIVTEARTRAVTDDDLREHVGRMGGSAYKPVSFDISLDDGCGMRFSDVHKVRSNACKALTKALLKAYDERNLPSVPPVARLQRDLAAHGVTAGTGMHGTAEICALVASPEAARAASEAGVTRLYATADACGAFEWPEGLRPIPWLGEVCREIDHERLDRWIDPGQGVAVGNVSELALARERGALPEVRPCIPIHNTSALCALVDTGASGVWLSHELSLAETIALADASPVPVGIIAYGRMRAMTSEHCVLQVAGRCAHDCSRCGLRRRSISLRNDHGEEFPVRTDLQGRSRIYAAAPFDAAPEAAQLVAGGVSRLMVDGTLLSPSELARAVRRLVAAVSAPEGAPAPGRLEGHTSGHLHREID